MVAAANVKRRPADAAAPGTFIDDLRFGELVDALKLIKETDDEAATGQSPKR